MTTKKRRPRSPKPTTVDYERWIKLLETGLSPREVAEAADVDYRTLKKYLPRAYENREARLARRELIGKALADHQSSLIDRLESIEQGARVPSHEQITPATSFRMAGQIMSTTNVDLDTKTYEVKPPDDDSVLSLLKEHLADQSQLWSYYRKFRELNAEYVDLCVRLGRDVMQELEAETGMTGKNPNGFGYSEPMIFALCGTAIDRAIGAEDLARPRLEIVGGGDVAELCWGGHQLARDEQGKLERARKFFHAKLKELQSDDRVHDIADATEVMEHLIRDIRSAVSELLLFRYIGGECRACERYGLVG